MSDTPEHSGEAPRGGSARRAARLGVLSGVLVGLVLFLLLHGSTSPRSTTACVGSSGAPEVQRVAPGYLSSLREGLARVIPQRVARLYEEGTVTAASAWTDEEPAAPAVSPTAQRPAGYEMRWWAPNGDDIVADVLVFSNHARAQRFLAMATSTRCRRKASRGAAQIPPLAHELSWLNPDNVAQTDVYFERGRRVYRLADAPSAQRAGKVQAGSLTRAFATIEALACLLPGARCPVGSKGVPA